MTKAVAIGLGGLLLGWGVLFSFLNMGGRSYCPGGACAPGRDTAFGLAVTFLIVGAIALVVSLAIAANTESWRKRSRFAFAATGLVVGLLPGWLWHDSLIGQRVRLDWHAPADRPEAVRGVGNWSVGSTVVRARTDGLTAYAGRDGQVRWDLTAPVRESVCAMSARTSKGTGLVAFSGYLKPCTTLTLVNLSTGKSLWQQKIKGDGSFRDATDGRIALADGTAVVLEEEAVRGLDAANGKQRWKRPVPRDCQAVTVEASAARLLLVEQCRKDRADDFTMRLTSLDAGTGKQRWSSPLPVKTGYSSLYTVSVEPAVIALKERDERGTAAVLSFDDTGRARATVPFAGRTETLAIGNGGFKARPALTALVVGDTLVTAAKEPGSSSARRVSGYSLADGRRLWSKKYGSGKVYSDEVEALAVRPGGRLAVLTKSFTDGTIRPLDPRTGRQAGDIEPVSGRDDLVGRTGAELLPDADRGYVVVNHDGTDDAPPVWGASR
ncbi:outer membrane protein assembly factor BamB family protein [Streptomyces syringium]|uniref:outer membrane protein assembly factor BamB family protein n=1 Tax=Streptomyces syringium TaxID=76729 RepID=UPI00341766CC